MIGSGDRSRALRGGNRGAVAWVGAAIVAAGLAGCASGPPPDYAPDPVLVEQIAELRMTTWPEQVCPGEAIRASYEAVLADGTVVPFATTYDKDRPPPLHVIFLHRASREARPRENGSWETYDDPLLSALDGFRLEARLKQQPELLATSEIAPRYDCVPQAFAFHGPNGRRGAAGGPGPDVEVRLDVLASPYYARLLVASIQVGGAPPFYVLQDADLVPPADWLLVESRGGAGGRGVAGAAGSAGAKGADGCPAGQGGAGGAGSNGGVGGPGGPGGHIAVFVSDAEPYLAGMVDARSPGGPGGRGGGPGEGGAGGKGGDGTAEDGTACDDGTAGPDGPDGAEGPPGAPGQPGPRARVLEVDPADLFRGPIPAELAQLLDYTRGR